MIKEEWKNVVGFEGFYMVSNYGRIKSLRRIVVKSNGVSMLLREKILKASITKGGYESISFTNTTFKQVIFIHRVVCAAFIGAIPENMEVCHYDGNRTNNFIGNLRYGTRSENMQDAVRHGTNHVPEYFKLRGENKKNSKINETIVRSIRLSKESSPVIARKYGISETLVKHVRRRVTWNHVT
jgi:hypothetical protein